MKGKGHHLWKSGQYSIMESPSPHVILSSHQLGSTKCFRPGFLGRIKEGNEVPIKWHVYYGVFLRATARKRGKRGYHHPHSKHGVSFTSLCCTTLFHGWSVWWRSLGRGADPAPSEHFESLKLGSGDLWDWDSMCESKTGVATDLNVFLFFSSTHSSK